MCIGIKVDIKDIIRQGEGIAIRMAHQGAHASDQAVYVIIKIDGFCSIIILDYLYEKCSRALKEKAYTFKFCLC